MPETPDLRAAIEIARLLSALAWKYGGPDRCLTLTPEDMRHPRGGLTRKYNHDGALEIRLDPGQPVRDRSVSS